MSIFGMIVTFVVVWWLVLFLVLPWGIHAHTKTDNTIITSGADMGAPKTPNIKKKFLITTGVAFIVWGFFAFIFFMDIVSVRSLL